MPYRIAVVDDSREDRERVLRIAEDVSRLLECPCTFQSFSETFDVSPSSFDAYLLDISMPHESGLQLARRIRASGNRCALIFISSVDGMVFEAIHVQPLRFVRKSCIKEELPEAFEAVVKFLRETDAETVLLNINGEPLRLNTPRILYAESFDKCQRLVMVEKSIDLRITMNELENKLMPFGFVRIHRSYLVNIHSVYCVSGCIAMMDNGDRLPVGKKYLANLNDRLREVMFQ